MRFQLATFPKKWSVSLYTVIESMKSDQFYRLDLLRLCRAGWHVLAGAEYLPSGAKSTEAGRHVWLHLLQQGAHTGLHHHAEEFAFHL